MPLSSTSPSSFDLYDVIFDNEEVMQRAALDAIKLACQDFSNKIQKIKQESLHRSDS